LQIIPHLFVFAFVFLFFIRISIGVAIDPVSLFSEGRFLSQDEVNTVQRIAVMPPSYFGLPQNQDLANVMQPGSVCLGRVLDRIPEY
jgi:hypothetical protein